MEKIIKVSNENFDEVTKKKKMGVREVKNLIESIEFII